MYFIAVTTETVAEGQINSYFKKNCQDLAGHITNGGKDFAAEFLYFRIPNYNSVKFELEIRAELTNKVINNDSQKAELERRRRIKELLRAFNT